MLNVCCGNLTSLLAPVVEKKCVAFLFFSIFFTISYLTAQNR